MSGSRMLDRTNDLHIWALHYIFLPMINLELSEWVHDQNHKKTTNDRQPGTRRSAFQRLHDGLASDPEEKRRREAEIEMKVGNHTDEQFYGNHQVLDSNTRTYLYPDTHPEVSWPTISSLQFTDEQRTHIQQKFGLIPSNYTAAINMWVNLKDYLETIFAEQ